LTFRSGSTIVQAIRFRFSRERPENKGVSTHDPGFVPSEVHQTG
jgi:hypothetical protein